MPPHEHPRSAGSSCDAGAAKSIPGQHWSGFATAVIVEPDPLVRLVAAQAARDLGFAISDTAPNNASRSDPPAVLLVGLDHLDQCARCVPRADVYGPNGRRQGHAPGTPMAPFTVGYVAGAQAILAAHSIHSCTDIVVALRAVDGRPTFVYASETRFGQSQPLPADLTSREADVLLFVLAGFTTSTIAARLWLSPATVRSHCRSILRKCGAADRRALRARLLGAEHNPSSGAVYRTWAATTGIPLACGTEIRQRGDS